MTVKRAGGLITLLAIAILAVILFSPNSKPAKQTLPPTCSNTAPACIKLTTASGQVYKLNDFRFAAGHCIRFVSLPDNRDQKYCGDYKLTWIGPGLPNARVQ